MVTGEQEKNSGAKAKIPEAGFDASCSCMADQNLSANPVCGVGTR